MPLPDIPGDGATPGPEGTNPLGKRLDSWGEIAAYLRREVRTVQRWEKTEGLPIHRHEHQKKSTVYAYTGELDAWIKKRQPKDDPDADRAFRPDTESEEEEEEDLEPNVMPPVPSPVVVQEPPAPQPPRRLFALAAATVLAIGLAVYVTYRLLPPSAGASGKVRLVVLPFANLSGDPKQDYFSAGLTDEMITKLGSLDPKHLGVIAAVSSSAVAGKPIKEIGRALDVQYALQGSVRRDASRLRIDVQLVQVSDQTHLWAESYDGELNDILRVQDEVGTAVASRIRLTLNPSSSAAAGPAAKRTVNPEAYDAYLRGRFYWTNRGDLHKSIEAYQLAIQKDPEYALAYAGLANAYALLGQVPYDDLPPSDAKPKAKEAAEHALRLDPQLPEAHAVLANVAFSYDWDFATAEREFQRAVALGPNNPISHLWFSHFCIVGNRMVQAMEENSRTLELDPVSPVFNAVRAQIEYSSRDYDAAIAQGTRITEQYPSYWLAYIWLGSAYREKKMYPQALEQFSKGRQLSGDHPVMIALYGHALAVSGDAAGAHKALADLQSLSRSRYVSSLYFAAIYTGLGEYSKAIDWLDRAYAEHNDYLGYLGLDPIADPLRSSPRFAQLLRKIGIQ